jgi:oligopeptide transport system permease protein
MNAAQPPATATAPTSAPFDTDERGHSPGRDAWLRLRKNRLAVAGGLFLGVLAVVCALAPMLFDLAYNDQNYQLGATPPSAAHWFGTDQLGRDLLSRLLYGGRISLMVGLVASLVALVIGVSYGAIAGYVGGALDRVMMRVVDILYALPFTIFVILMMVVLDQPMKDLDAWLRNSAGFADAQGLGKILGLFVAIGAVEWLTMARIVRGQVLTIKKMEYIEAARTLGYGPLRIIFRHIVPNLMGPVIVFTTLTIPAVILLESFLSFLGLGVADPMSSWGKLLKDGAENIESYPWLVIFPGAFFALTLLSFNLLGDGLRDALDVRAAKD